jgi:hypothetical protein
MTKANIDTIKNLGGGDLSALKALIPDKELIGTYWTTWLPTNNQYANSLFGNDTSNADLKVWGRIGTPAQMPVSITQPMLIPNVKIESITLPTNAKVNSLFGNLLPSTTTVKVVNNESVNLTITWQANSSVTGNFDGGTVTVPKNSFVVITKSYYYYSAGPATITYAISHNGTQLDSESATMTVVP